MGVNEKGEEPAKSGRVRSGKARMDLLNAAQRAELARQAATARWHTGKSAGASSNINRDLQVILRPQSAADRQRTLSLGIARQIEIDGVGMGVLSDGTAFLTGRGLARLCGVTHAQIQRLSADWIEGASKARIETIKELLRQRGVEADKPSIAVDQRSGSFFAYPDFVCLAILEYYAFESAEPQPEARKNFRLLAGAALREFIYKEVGYDPSNSVPDAWKQFHDRVSLTYNSVPRGFFGIFKEMADMIVTLGQSGLHIDSKFVPDISVGIHWSKFWNANEYDQRFGARVQFEHNYPGYFPQARSNPQDSWCYPESALGEFRRWLREVYIGEGKFAKYITGQAEKRELPISFAQLAIAAYSGTDE
jgi:hypothetical protein